MNKNIKILIPVFIIMAIVHAVVFHFLGKQATDHIVYKNSIEYARSNSTFAEKIGLPLESHKHTSYSLRNNATAKYKIHVVGSKSNGTLFVYSERKGSDWILKELELHHENHSYDLLKQLP